VPAGLFNARNGYLPVYGFETNVANDYGKIVIKQGGGCSASPDTGFAFDFQVPCKAHDYCYDMRKAGFSGIVGDTDCDNAFYWLMEAHCNNRVLSGDCRITRDAYFYAVTRSWVVTNADPAPVSFKAVHSNKCADVSGSGNTENVPIIQFSCTGNSNQKFKVFPSFLSAGRYEIRPTHVTPFQDRCAYRNANANVYQATCQQTTSFQVRIVGSFSQNIFTVRPQSNSSCWDIPYSSLNDSIQVSTYTCTETSNQRWIVS
jgi:Ricin-type beta-trefoil lectin domain/Prokaryotic phospholipase A2